MEIVGWNKCVCLGPNLLHVWTSTNRRLFEEGKHKKNTTRLVTQAKPNTKLKKKWRDRVTYRICMFVKSAVIYFKGNPNWYLLQAGRNHLNFGYESPGYETSVGTKRRDYSFKRKLSQWSNLSPSALELPNETEVFLLLYQRSQNGIHLTTEWCSFAYWYTAHYLVLFARSLIFWDNLFHWLPERTACDAVKDSLQLSSASQHYLRRLLFF